MHVDAGKNVLCIHSALDVMNDCFFFFFTRVQKSTVNPFPFCPVCCDEEEVSIKLEKRKQIT